jgi:menaquinone-dependent protoporphyrinogen IX oxidase
MKIGIFVHSQTGNTMSVAEKIKEKYIKNGDSVYAEKIDPVGGENMNETNILNINFASIPDLKGYDRIIVCGPVRAFSISPVLNSFLNKVADLKGQKIELFVTQTLSQKWMGGNHAISQMKAICIKKGAIVEKTAIVNWKNRNRESVIAEITDTF